MGIRPKLAKDGIHRFMSLIRGRVIAMAMPEFFNFPSHFSDGWVLCFKGNSMSSGVNQYAFAFPETLQPNVLFLRG